jgi:hypothetical protein
MKYLNKNKFNYNKKNLSQNNKQTNNPMFGNFPFQINTSPIELSNKNTLINFNILDELVNKLTIQEQEVNENLLSELKVLNNKLDDILEFLNNSNLKNQNGPEDIKLETNILKKIIDHKITKVNEHVFKYVSFFGIEQKNTIVNKITEIQNNNNNINLIDINKKETWDDDEYDYIKKKILI